MNQTKSTTDTHALHALLCDTYVLAIKTHAAHWNVTGPSFNGLHIAFETQYAQLLEGADILAERLRALRHPAPRGMQELLEGAQLKSAIPGTDGVQLAKTLSEDHRRIAKNCQKASDEAEKSGDSATSDLLVARIEEHEKTAWMLEATAS
jgi:starvation-inducible DNA-binding protein